MEIPCTSHTAMYVIINVEIPLKTILFNRKMRGKKKKKDLHKLGVHHKMEAPQSVPEDYRVPDSILVGGKWGRIMLTFHPIPALVAPKRRHFSQSPENLDG